MFGVAQICSKSCEKHNLYNIIEPLIKQASSKGCMFLCFPEAFDYITVPGSGLSKQKAVYIDDDRIKKYCSLAAENKIWLSLGGLHEKLRNEDKIANSHLIVNDKGKILANYKKIHLFDANVEIQGGYRESSSTVRGTEIFAVNTPFGMIGLTTCFDLRFPEIYSKLRSVGCHVILVPSAFMPSTGEVHWHCLLKARAIENQVYIVAAAQTGAHNEKRSSYGHSLVVDPWGKVLFDLKTQENVIETFDISTELIDKVRKKIPMNITQRISDIDVTIIK